MKISHICIHAGPNENESKAIGKKVRVKDYENEDSKFVYNGYTVRVRAYMPPLT